MEQITWEEEWVEGDEGEPYYAECAALGDYSASVSYLGAFIDYNGLPATLGVGITLDDSILAGVDFADRDWAEERLRYRAEHGHTSADITSASGPSHKYGEPEPSLPWDCGAPAHNWLSCAKCLEQYDNYRAMQRYQ